MSEYQDRKLSLIISLLVEAAIEARFDFNRLSIKDWETLDYEGWSLEDIGVDEENVKLMEQ